MKKYKQLTSEQRYTIFRLHKEKCSLRSIAKYINVAPSTVSRELKRNRNGRGKYYYQQAQLFAGERHQWKQHPRKLKGRLQLEIEERIRLDQWSPEQIVGRYKLEGKAIVSKNNHL